MYTRVKFTVTFDNMKNLKSVTDIQRLKENMRAVLTRLHPNYLTASDLKVEIENFNGEKNDKI
jgi:hypothetical protein